MRYQFKDLLLAPAWLSWLRLPLAACFVAFVDRPLVAVSVLMAAGLSDVLDGWVARRCGYWRRAFRTKPPAMTGARLG